MKYYEVQQNHNIDVIGCCPQVKELRIDFHKAKASQWGFISDWKSDDEIPDLNNFLFESKAKPTDLIDNTFMINPCGILVSERCASVFDKYLINGTKHPASIYHKTKKLPYFFYWFEYRSHSKINWSKTKFREVNKINLSKPEYGEEIIIKNFEDYKIKFREIRKKGVFWRLETNVLFLDKEYDLFSSFSHHLVCNENLKTAIELAELKGFDFKLTDLNVFS